jgi:hypothetical protein
MVRLPLHRHSGLCAVSSNVVRVELDDPAELSRESPLRNHNSLSVRMPGDVRVESLGADSRLNLWLATFDVDDCKFRDPVCASRLETEL